MKGKSFWREDSKNIEGDPRWHLYFIISDPDVDNNVLVVNMTTFRNKKNDFSCILNIGDHPTIKHKSYIIYERATEDSVQNIMNWAKEKKIVFKDNLEPIVLKRIQKGAKRSDALPDGFKKYFSCF